MTATHSFYRNLGLAGGSLWLILAGAGFPAWPLLTVHSRLAVSLLAVYVFAALALFFFGVRLVRTVRQLPHGSAADPSYRRRIARQFGLVVAVEVAALALAARLCAATHHFAALVPIDLIIVGLHFLPLARLFQVPRYYVTGALFCILPVATMLLCSSSVRVGHTLAWIVIPSVACGLVALATGAAGLDEVQRFLNSCRTPPACAQTA